LWYNAPKKLPAGDKSQSAAPEDGRNYRPKYVELIEITIKLFLNPVGCLYYYINKSLLIKYFIFPKRELFAPVQAVNVKRCEPTMNLQITELLRAYKLMLLAAIILKQLQRYGGAIFVNS